MALQCLADPAYVELDCRPRVAGGLVCPQCIGDHGCLAWLSSVQQYGEQEPESVSRPG
jgi:hypothetical protein